MKKMPTMFVGHGSPMNAIEENEFTEFLTKIPSIIETPKAILVVSAHWETLGTKVLKVAHPKTIHDFGGFPKPLYEIQYPALGSFEVADRVAELLNIEAVSNWGLDHGAWSVLRHMYPKAQIPVLQLSLDRNLSFTEHLKLAGKLAPLRDEGVLILGSGNITHNLRRVVWEENASPVKWASDFDLMIKEAILNRDEKVLLKQVDHESLWEIAHPSFEHYLPLLYAYGASTSDEPVTFLYEGMQMGTLSMRSVMFG